jgi:hypothetical protein
MGDFERAWAFPTQLNRILQGVDLLDIFLVRVIDKETDDGNGIAGTNQLSGQSVATRTVIGVPSLGW